MVTRKEDSQSKKLYPFSLIDSCCQALSLLPRRPTHQNIDPFCHIDNAAISQHSQPANIARPIAVIPVVWCLHPRPPVYSPSAVPTFMQLPAAWIPPSECIHPQFPAAWLESAHRQI
ncbi:hypothetical protein B0T21DRAFT_366060 [Apiosordaria backusii]|uniref:Uncharacterized protein n=1 Tax=Apiosordaria backusii TaxID=314023 RepID=A0AA40BKR5_9PEZI|nr:hypothetical protein B0T21DRAFT_366060 [Apiosordaria backusii]